MLCGCALGSCARAAHWQRAQQLMQDVDESAVEANAAKLQPVQKSASRCTKGNACLLEVLLRSSLLSSFSRASRPVEASLMHTNIRS